MATSSEEVLLIVHHVRHKKSEGVLYMMGERMAWMLKSKDSFSVSHSYADIKMQKISPDTKEKVQLQISLHDGGANTFQFTNPKGRPESVSDREGVKELLQQLLPKFRRKINSELEEKNRMLQEDAELFQLYKDLVVSQVISAEEFWANRVKNMNKPTSEPTPVGNKAPSNPVASTSKQDVGVSASFLAEVKPQSDGCNGLKYNITTDIIESIFKTYPAVQSKYQEHVPHNMSESAFWTKFFQSHYFHRDRINIHTTELFAECAKKDEEDIQSAIGECSADPLVDLTHMSDSTLDEDYGTKNNDTMDKVNKESANLSIIRRFNHHSTRILQTGDTRAPKTIDQGVNEIDKSKVTSGTSLEPPMKKARLQEKIEYTDLEASNSSQGITLNLTHQDRYLHGPTPANNATFMTSYEVEEAISNFKNDVRNLSPAFSKVLSSNAAVSAITDLSPGGILMQNTSKQKLQDLVSVELQQEVKNLYSALCELLRHFWSCFPTTTPLLEEKVVKMRGTLERFQHAKLQPLKDKVVQYHCPVDLTLHLDELLSTAYTKFESWHARRKK
ncbi:unnamed protein product [Owenia fusiformis]|uniref:Uncharacterized protein n=1 Tax=Owenia fusiformis TaxID=6347 RepID=A0A8J1XV26_OWEFU|nr:unnamed protein product [Owenia fusiformis]